MQKTNKQTTTVLPICHDIYLPFLSNIWSVYVTPAVPVLPPVVVRDVHLSFRLWYEAVASSNTGAGGGRSPVDANTVELQESIRCVKMARGNEVQKRHFFLFWLGNALNRKENRWWREFKLLLMGPHWLPCTLKEFKSTQISTGINGI